MSKPKKKLWSQSVGPYGARVRVAENTPGGRLYLLWVDRERRQRKRSLGHRDRKRGAREALELSSRLANYKDAVEAGKLTLKRLVDLYLQEGLHGRSPKYCDEARKKLELWLRFLGPERGVESLNPADVDRFGLARKSGGIRAGKNHRRAPISNTTLWHDFVALNIALNFAVRYRDAHGRRLLTANPLVGVKVSKSMNPSRPVADEEFFSAMKQAAAKIESPLFELALDLAYGTGHRIDAILNLRWDDVSFEAAPGSPGGSIRWRAEHDKIGNEHIVPMNPMVREALQRAKRARPAIGETLVFPSESDPSRPVERRLTNRWFRRAEKLAGLEHVQGRGWHAFRRGWASSRKHLPDVDVAHAGGWKDTATLKRCYQHADAEGVLRAVNEARPLVRAGRVIPGVIPPARSNEGPNRVSAVGASI